MLNFNHWILYCHDSLAINWPTLIEAQQHYLTVLNIGRYKYVYNPARFSTVFLTEPEINVRARVVDCVRQHQIHKWQYLSCNHSDIKHHILAHPEEQKQQLRFTGGFHCNWHNKRLFSFSPKTIARANEIKAEKAWLNIHITARLHSQNRPDERIIIQRESQQLEYN